MGIRANCSGKDNSMTYIPNKVKPRFAPTPKRPKAIWTQAFPKQAIALRPENGKAGGVKSRSQPEAVRMAVYNAINLLYALQFPLCEACELIGRYLDTDWHVHCREQTHHVRGRYGLLLFDVRYFRSVCSECHSWIDANRDAARKLGLLADEGDWGKI